MSRFSKILSTSVVFLMSGCASLPNGPSVMVLPGTGQPFEKFSSDNAICQRYAYGQVGGTTANQASVNSGLASAAAGAALGAAAGAAIGGGEGAAIGAGTGLAAGGLVGTSAANSSMYSNQERFDNAYIQCMYAKGHQVPVSGNFTNIPSSNAVSPTVNIPPPPPGSPPPPPTK